MRGKRNVTAIDVLERIADGCNIPDGCRALLGLAPHGRECRQDIAIRATDHDTAVGLVSEPRPTSTMYDLDKVDVSLPWSPSGTIEMIGHLTRKDLALDRRTATRAIVGVAVGGTLLEPLERWLSGSVPEKATRDRPSTISPHEVEQIELAATLFRNWDDHFGGGLRRKAVIGQLSEVSDILRESHSSDIARRLFRATAELSETAAMMSWDSGLGGIAQRYYVLALQASKAAGDRALGANILAGLARQLLYMDHAREALELVRLAQDGSAGRATPTLQAMLHTREAWAYAKEGRVSAFRRATEKAELALLSRGAAGAGKDPDWIGYFDEAELAGVTGGRLLELAHQEPRLAEEAADYIERAINLRQNYRIRSLALDWVGLAEARLRQGELEEASRLGHSAVEIVERTPSDRVRLKLIELYQCAKVHNRTPAIAEMCDRLRSVLLSRPLSGRNHDAPEKRG